MNRFIAVALALLMASFIATALFAVSPTFIFGDGLIGQARSGIYWATTRYERRSLN
jgi:hypothetical protein